MKDDACTPRRPYQPPPHRPGLQPSHCAPCNGQKSRSFSVPGHRSTSVVTLQNRSGIHSSTSCVCLCSRARWEVRGKAHADGRALDGNCGTEQHVVDVLPMANNTAADHFLLMTSSGASGADSRQLVGQRAMLPLGRPRGGAGGGAQKVTCGPAGVLQPRPPSHGLHRLLSSIRVRLPLNVPLPHCPAP